ncbi:hypothetical protein BDN70DRAFT_913050 [Pholiota conissans]|uniref:3'-5' exonuclease domain-containing protein n=1 Tax=Pholiota conissans TaxID=109636 RepID=A0A9P5Z1P5_9AGAR|nr:hypothetical protein BDN70DRAFT_913050 [Pholiota conissans]
MNSFDIILVDTEDLLDACINDLSSTDTRHISKLAIDLEGVELCRIGRISTLQIIADGSQTIWIIDITVLGKLAFDHVDSEGRSLRQILESTETQKLLYDVRNDADALIHLYGIELANTYDLQLLEVAVRRSCNLRVRLVSGLGKAIETYIKPPAQWEQVKRAGAALCFPDKGGSYDAFEKRPLDARVIEYAAQDVSLLFELEKILEGRIGSFGNDWMGRVSQASAARVHEAYGAYAGHGQHRALAPTV